MRTRKFLSTGKVGHIQISGVPGRHEPDSDPLEDQEINYPYIFRLLDELEYKGWVSCEHRPRNGTLEGLARWGGPHGLGGNSDTRRGGGGGGGGGERPGRASPPIGSSSSPTGSGAQRFFGSMSTAQKGAVPVSSNAPQLEPSAAAGRSSGDLMLRKGSERMCLRAKSSLVSANRWPGS